jgi:hypothetical protein
MSSTVVDSRPFCFYYYLFVGLMLAPVFARAEFVLNFSPDNPYEIPGGNGTISTIYWNSDNYWGHVGVQTGSAGTPAQTPYLYDGNSLERPQIVTDPITGKKYYHMIFGDMANGFIQESYIEMGFGNYGSQSLGEPLNSASASGGHSVHDSTTVFGNGYDPLDMNVDYAAQAVTSGSGTGNPTRVIVRQIMSDGEIMSEFYKDRYANKPRITQMIQAPDIAVMFDLDMRHIDYDTNSANAYMTNRMQLLQGNLPQSGSSFDMATDAADSNMNAGKYTYTAGSGFGGSEGTYTYSDGGFDQTAVPWGDYLDPNTYNPWAFETGKGQ